LHIVFILTSTPAVKPLAGESLPLRPARSGAAAAPPGAPGGPVTPGRGRAGEIRAV
jgi:hypothetical protein